jgi:hypothetical protein
MNHTIMFHVVACVVCGGDPIVDSMLINSVVSGVIATPWIFKAQIVATVRRVRGVRPDPSDDECPLPTAVDAEVAEGSSAEDARG